MQRSEIVVRSRERAELRFRYEARQGGVVLQSAEFTLRPGGQERFAAVYPAGVARIEVRLYRAGSTAPYRSLIL